MRLAFRREDGVPFEFVPGQFVTLHLPWDEMVLRRSYSIASVDGGADGHEIEVAATMIEGGRASTVLEGLRPGDRIEATGPFGRFVLRDDPPSRYLLLATGTGVSPYRAMLPALRERLALPGYEAVLLLGVRSPEELLFAEDFRAFEAQCAAFRFRPSYSRHRPSAAGAEHGYVQHRLPALEPDPARDIAYLCGNPDMIDEAVETLKSHGFGNPRIRREKYVSAN